MLRKVLFGSIFIFLLTCSIFGQRKDGDWTLLNSGQSALGIEFRKDGTVYYENKLLMICPIDAEEPFGSEIQISTPSKTKKLIVVHCRQDSVASAALVVDTVNKEAITKDIVPPNWRLALWLNWSPNEDYLLMAAAGEVTNGDMFVVNLKTARSTEITFKKFIKNDEDELQELDFDKISWITPTKYSLVLDVKCNPYVLGERDCDRTKILRSQSAQVNISTLAITYGIAKTTTTTKVAQSTIRKIDFRNFTYMNVKHPDEELVDIKVNKGKYIKGDQGSYNSWDFVINEVVYGDVTNDGQEDALIRATLTTYGSSNPASLDSAYFFLYTSEIGTPTRTYEVDVWKDYEPFSNFQSGCEELILGAKIKTISAGKATLNLLVTGIDCTHKGFTITLNYVWRDNKMVLVGKPLKARTR